MPIVSGLNTTGIWQVAPGATLPTRLLQLRHPTLGANELEARLRGLDPAVISRIEHDHVVLDLRTVLPGEDEILAKLLQF